MKKWIIILIFTLLFSLVCLTEGIANNNTDTMVVHLGVDEIVMINLNPGSDITLTISAPDNAGEIPEDVVNDSNFAQYTATVSENSHRKMTAKLSGTGLTGCSLKLEAQVGNGENEGISAGQVTLSSESASDLITSIGNCATGTSMIDGSEDGAKLIYTLSIDNLASLIAGQQKHLTVTFTLTDF